MYFLETTVLHVIYNTVLVSPQSLAYCIRGWGLVKRLASTVAMNTNIVAEQENRTTRYFTTKIIL